MFSLRAFGDGAPLTVSLVAEASVTRNGNVGGPGGGRPEGHAHALETEEASEDPDSLGYLPQGV